MNAGLTHVTTEGEEQLKMILESPGFQKAPALRNLLLHLWRHRGQPVNEYSVATEALGRKLDFDPRVDATVRVHVARLRQKLKEFYETEGRNSPLVISIPLGCHDLDVRPNPGIGDFSVSEGRLWNGRHILGWALSVLLAIVCVGLYVENRELAVTIHEKDGRLALPKFWGAFFSNGKPTSLFLPTPVFFEWDSTNLKLRDPQVNDFGDFHNSPELRSYTENWGTPRLLQNYTVASDSFAGLKLVQYLQSKGTAVSFGGTGELSLNLLSDHNIILLGTPGITSRHLKELMEKTNFYFPGGVGILNRNPRPGELAKYEEIVQSNLRRTSPGLITLMPGKGGTTHLLTLTGRDTFALAAFLISPDTLELFDVAWQKEGSPQYFEVVVQTEIEGSKVLKAWPVTLRAFNLTSW